MPVEVRLLKVGMTMTEGSVEEWYIADGDQVQKGEMLYRLETEKVNMDVDAEADGTVKHLVPAGTELGPGDVIGFVFRVGRDHSGRLTDSDSIARRRAGRRKEGSSASSSNSSAEAETRGWPAPSGLPRRTAAGRRTRCRPGGG